MLHANMRRNGRFDCWHARMSFMWRGDGIIAFIWTSIKTEFDRRPWSMHFCQTFSLVHFMSPSFSCC